MFYKFNRWFFVNKLLSKKPIEREIFQKQLDLVYSPMFQKIENNLYKKIDENTAQKYILFFNQIKAEHYSLIENKTLIEFNTFEKNFLNNHFISYRNFSNLCYNIDKNFERLRKKLGLPTRHFSYKWRYAQYPKNIQLRIEKFLKFIVILIILTFAGFFIFSIVYLISSFFSSLIIKLTN